jgi:hypothetical protein
MNLRAQVRRLWIICIVVAVLGTAGAARTEEVCIRPPAYPGATPPDDGVWTTPLPACAAGRTYRFSGEFRRDTWDDRTYPWISLWGEKFPLNAHCRTGAPQTLHVRVTCPERITDPTFRFGAEPASAGGVPQRFCLGAHSLAAAPPEAAPNTALWTPPPSIAGFFPIGVYGADPARLAEVRAVAFNTVILGGEGEPLAKAIASARNERLRYVLSTPGDPEPLKVYLDRLDAVPRVRAGGLLGFYVADEPELRSVPIARAEDVRRLLADRFPGVATAMAIVRPRHARDYLGAADYFMMDQYPFPHRPMTWLSDAMDEAAADTGRDRLMSVIQAFTEGEAWPSLPGWRQMDCLAFLSIVHGSRGIFFYTWSVMGRTEEGRARLGRVVGRLNRVYPWLLVKNAERAVDVEMRSENRVDPRGRPAVHACVKVREEGLLLIAVNTIGANVTARLKLGAVGEAVEVFSGRVHPVVDGAILADLDTHETKAFLIKSGRE